MREIPGADAQRGAGGKLCPASEFHNLESARGRSVLVVGYGKSSCGVARMTSPLEPRWARSG